MTMLTTMVGEDVAVSVLFTYHEEVSESNFHRLPDPEAYRDAEVEIAQVFVAHNIDILSVLSQEIVDRLEEKCAEAWEGPEEEPED